MRKHALHIINWGNRLQRCCQAVLGDMPPQHEYFDWFKRVTRRFIDVPGATLTILIEGYLRLLSRYPVGTEDHQDIIDVLTAVQAIGRVRPRDPEVPNEEAATPAAAATQRPSITESPSTSTAPNRHLHVRTPRVVPISDPPPPTPHPSLSPTIPSPTLHPSRSPTIPPLIPHPCVGPDIRPPTPRLFPEMSPIPSFDLGIHLTPPDIQQEPPFDSMSIGPSSAINPPHVHVEEAGGLPVQQEGRPKRISKAPPCGTGGTNMDTTLGPSHLTKDMQDLLLIIRDGIRSKKDDDAMKRLEALKFKFNTIKVATNNFSNANKLGGGSF
uniref:Uncharacterized protein n=1 Tax=Quercus lobata TaxID=97700 RepID=A0A7N2MG49_QUELO